MGIAAFEVGVVEALVELEDVVDVVGLLVVGVVAVGLVPVLVGVVADGVDAVPVPVVEGTGVEEELPEAEDELAVKQLVSLPV